MKKRILVLMSIMMLAMVGCESQPVTPQTPTGEVPPATSEQPAEDTQGDVTEPVNVIVYYSNVQSDGFEQKEMQIEGLTPENLIDELAKVNIVSIDTEVVSFVQSGKSLQLDLSEGFSQYANMMGSSGEYVVMGGLVNTFLDAYDAEEILITVEGKTLETGHAIYDKPLTFYATESAEDSTDAETGAKAPMAYRLKDEAYNHNNAEIYYPQFVDMPDGSIQDKWNAAIRELTVGAAEAMIGDYEEYEIDYDIMTCDTEFVSFVFEREVSVGGRDVEDKFAISFDLVEGKVVRLSDWGEAVDAIAYNLANHGYYKILDDDIDRETYDEYMKMTLPDAEEYMRQFSKYDYDLEDLETEPAGTSYVKDGILVIIMDVPDALGGTLEIETGVEVR